MHEVRYHTILIVCQVRALKGQTAEVGIVRVVPNIPVQRTLGICKTNWGIFFLTNMWNLATINISSRKPTLRNHRPKTIPRVKQWVQPHTDTCITHTYTRYCTSPITPPLFLWNTSPASLYQGDGRLRNVTVNIGNARRRDSTNLLRRESFTPSYG